MKVHRIEMFNLNSLYGEHVLDFDEHFEGAPLFLIHGPTGAGKSTILDAVCLALFGQTPRLNLQNRSPETSTEYIMSHGEGQCRAAIEFSRRSHQGARTRYRAAWSCRRAHHKADGKAQKPERSLEKLGDDGSWQLIVSSHLGKQFREPFKQVLEGLTVDDFQRSVMLAQGDFARFLNASPDEKASILERLTDTHLYRQIGQRAANQHRHVDAELSMLDAKMLSTELLTPAEESKLEAEIEAISAAIGALRMRREELAVQRVWIDALGELRAELERATLHRAECLARRDALADDFERLRQDQRCRVAEPLLQSVVKLRSELVDLDLSLPGLREAAIEQDRLLCEARATQDDAYTALLEAKAAFEEARPAITEARGFRTELKTATDELSAARERLSLADAVHKSAQLALDAAKQRGAEADQAIAEATRRLEALAKSMSVRERLADWQTRHHLLQEQREARGAQLSRHSGFVADQDDLRAERHGLDAQLASERTRHDELQQIASTATAALQALLDGSDMRTLRSSLAIEQAALAARLETLKKCSPLVDRLNELDAERLVVSERHEKMTRDHDLVLDRIAAASADHEKAVEAATICEQAVQGIARALSLAHARQSLDEGAHCPVCGSLDHPFLGDSDTTQAEARLKERHDALDQSLRDARQHLESSRDALSSAQKDDVLFKTTLAELSDQLAALAIKAGSQTEILRALLAEAGLDPSEDSRAMAEALNALIATLDAARRDCATKLATLQSCAECVEDASAALRVAIDAQITNATRRREIDQSLQTAAARASELEVSIGVLAEKIVLVEQDLVGELGACNVVCAALGGEPDIAEAIGRAALVLDEIIATEAALAAAQRSATAAHDALVAADKHFDSADAARESAQLDELARGAAVQRFAEHLDACLGGRNPDDVEAGLLKAQQSGEKQLEAAQGKLADSTAALTRAEAARDNATENRKSRAQAHDTAGDALARQLAELELADEHALLACLLAPEQRTRLEEETHGIQLALESSEAVHRAGDARLTKHITERPALLAEGAELADDALESDLSVLDAEIAGESEHLGDLKGRRLRQTRLKSELEHTRHARDEKAQEAHTWETIHKLIGVQNGEGFQRFAQSLNLQELVDQANIWLHKLYPRYALSVSLGEHQEPLLAFSVIDLDNADLVRPITTLSGGETFLVSLALALALADFRQVTLPVETIFLDEGFGTLDSETLNMVIAVLNTLQRDSGRQIGIISHVEELKERVEHRVLVEKLGNGRAKLHVTSPRGIPLPARSDSQAI
ncbi:MAG: AAA family ATPase [Bradymonadaceae bacterium]|nr:AAA family ATPase [Lujinxingiaceae bacterium]